MDVFNKIYTSVQISVSAVLPGNIVTKEYELLRQVTYAGIGILDLQWKVYSGVKRTTKQNVSIFVFEKKTIENWPKDRKENLLDKLRYGVQQLTKMKHPRILTVQHTLEESRDCLAFATEPIIASLSNTLEDSSSEVKLFDVEILHGFQQIIDGLIFIHSDAHIIHGNLSPESILIDKRRNWKIFGFEFSCRNNPKDFKHQSYGNTSFVRPCHKFLAPETTTGITVPESDIFSLGMLMYCVCSGESTTDFNKTSLMKKTDMKSNPYNLINILQTMVHPSPNYRPTLQELTQLQHFQDTGVKTLSNLDTLYQWDNLQKSKFFKSLMHIIPNLPHRVNIYSVIPYLVQEFVNLPMVPFVLPIILAIAEMSAQQEYTDCILPALKFVFNIEDPIQIPLILMQKIYVLLKQTNADDVNTYIVPFVSRSLEMGSTELNELALEVVPYLSSIIQCSAQKTSVLGKVEKLYLKSTSVPIKVKCLICIGKLLEHLDRSVLITDILPFIQQVQTREPVIIMAIIGVYRIALSNPKLGITAEALATKCIPHLVPICTVSTLSIYQFDCVTAIIKEMFDKVEKKHRTKLQESSAVTQGLGSNSALWQCSKSKLDQIASNTIAGQKQESDTEDTGKNIFEESTNPLVLGHQLMTPSLTNEEYKNKYPPIMNAHKTKKSDLVPLSNQDIINFLK